MRDAIVTLKDSRTNHGQHAGLLLQRYLCENATGDDGNPDEKRAILQAAINAATDHGVRKLYEQAFKCWKNAVQQHGPQTVKTTELATPGRLIVGLGSENVLETGITLHHTYGMPMIPGSALKGLAAHYCDQVSGADDVKFRKLASRDDEAYRKYLLGEGEKPEDNYHRLLFGNTDDSGCIIFHDAWYVPDSSDNPFVLDVMTPHHPKWLDGSAPPTDFDSPKPVPFLSVTGRFHIALSWRGPDSNESEKWIDLAIALITHSLADWGVGGKTSSGYGRLVDPEAIPVASTPPAQRKAERTFSRGDKVNIEATMKATKAKGNKPGKPLYLIADTKQLGFFQEGQTPPVIGEGELAEVWIANTGENFTFTLSEVKKRNQQQSRKARTKR